MNKLNNVLNKNEWNIILYKILYKFLSFNKKEYKKILCNYINKFFRINRIKKFEKCKKKLNNHKSLK